MSRYDWEKTVVAADGFKQLFNNSFAADILFEFLDGDNDDDRYRTLYAHSLVLIVRSKLFSNSFLINPPKFGVLKRIRALFRYEIFYEFLKFMYTDVCDINLDNACQLLQVANVYAVQVLEHECANFLLSNNAPGLLTVSITEHKISDLGITFSDLAIYKAAALEFIAKNFNKCVLQNELFLEVDDSTLHEILSLDPVSITSEFAIFQIAIYWANRACEKNGKSLTSGQSKREMLGASLKLIRFAAMDCETFGRCVQLVPELLEAEEIAAIFMNILMGQKNPFGFSDKNRQAFASKDLNALREMDGEQTTPTKVTVVDDKTPQQLDGKCVQSVAELLDLEDTANFVKPFSDGQGVAGGRRGGRGRDRGIQNNFAVFLPLQHNRKILTEYVHRKFSMRFEVSQNVILYGFSINGSCIDISFDIFNNDFEIFKGTTGPNNRNNKVLIKPVAIRANELYVIRYWFYNIPVGRCIKIWDLENPLPYYFIRRQINTVFTFYEAPQHLSQFFFKLN